MHPSSDVIDDLSRNPLLATIGTPWQVVTDQAMGGMSSGTLVREIVGGRPAIHMRGSVRLENNGGFVQIGLDLAQQRPRHLRFAHFRLAGVRVFPVQIERVVDSAEKEQTECHRHYHLQQGEGPAFSGRSRR